MAHVEALAQREYPYDEDRADNESLLRARRHERTDDGEHDAKEHRCR